ncbi:hypothetical protein J6590_067791 [Homalodisca vitripennis]|nr:hypothetical protein J6590_067791 [Homalodisca vitripennis]
MVAARAEGGEKPCLRRERVAELRTYGDVCRSNPITLFHRRYFVAFVLYPHVN